MKLRADVIQEDIESKTLDFLVGLSLVGTLTLQKTKNCDSILVTTSY